jgi:hypothetical protein
VHSQLLVGQQAHFVSSSMQQAEEALDADAQSSQLRASRTVSFSESTRRGSLLRRESVQSMKGQFVKADDLLFEAAVTPLFFRVRLQISDFWMYSKREFT